MLCTLHVLSGSYYKTSTVTGLVFENSRYDRKRITVIKINSTVHCFYNNMYNRKGIAVMKMNSAIHQKSEQYV